MSTNDGLALAGSNCDHVYYGTAIGLTFLQPPCIDTHPPAGDQSQVSTMYRRRAFDYMSNHEQQLPLVVAARIGRTWSLYRPLDMISFNLAEGKERFVNIACIATYYPMAALALLGGWLLSRRRRGMLWPLVVPAVAVTVGVALTYGQTRFRAAAEPPIVLLAAFALVAMWESWRGRRRHERTQGVTP